MAFLQNLIIIILTIFALNGCVNPGIREQLKNLEFKETAFKIPDYKREVLDNGMVIYLMEDKELPIFKLDMFMNVGSIYEPPNKLGLAGITGGTMLTGGNKKMSGDEIDKEIDFLGGDINVGIANEHGNAYLSVLKKDIDRGLEILADVMMSPVFKKEKIQLKKNNLIEIIRRQNDNPQSIANREFSRLVYGNDHFYSRTPTIEMIKSISRDDVIDFYKRYISPNNIILGVTGDFDNESMLKKIQYYFSKWPKKEIDFPKIKKTTKGVKKSVNYIFKDQSQTVIRVGHKGIQKDNPDKYALVILNEIFGGGSFQSRLMREVRSDKGLAYSIWSHFGIGKKDLGLFKISCETKSSSTTEVISIILDNLKRITEEYVSDEELQVIKDSIINSFIFKFDSKKEVLDRLMYLEFFGLPKDYFYTYRKNIAKVTKEDILRVAKKYININDIVVLTVGNAKEFGEPLDKFGNVNTITLNSGLKQK